LQQNLLQQTQTRKEKGEVVPDTTPQPIITFAEYEMEAAKTAQYPSIGHNIIYPTLGLTGEAGEVADKVKKLFRDRNGDLNSKYRREIALEASDVLWYLAALSKEIGYTLGEIAALNIKKLADRQQRGKLGGEGDNR
jgi:NTP pyrophosphatase (non-canonical NTP hydrolase)